MFLPDINVWLALTFESHFHHESAKQWFSGVDADQAFFCRLTQMGYLRLATNPSAFGKEALTLKEAWSCYDALLEDERIAFMAEPEEIERLWRSWTSISTYSHKIWNDAFLASFAAITELRLVSFDRAIRQFSEAEALILK